MSMFDERRHGSDGNDNGPRIDRFSEASFDLGEAGRQHRADRATLRAIDEMLENPTDIPFERVKSIVRYLEGEALARRFPGAVKVDHRYFLDPEPKRTESGPLFQGYRLHIARSQYDPEIVIQVSLKPNFIQFADGGVLTGGHMEQQFGERKVADWLMRVPVGRTLEIERSVFDSRHCTLRAVDFSGHPSFTDLSRVRLGTPASLGLINLPGRLLMLDSRQPESSTLGAICGTWHDQFGVYADGVHLKAHFGRIPGLLRDRSLLVRNVGDVPFLLYFEEPRRKE